MLGTRFNILRAAALILASASALLSAGTPAKAAAPKHRFLVMMEHPST